VAVGVAVGVPQAVTIRQRVEGPAPQPDGPPLDRRTASRYFLALADGVEEAYAALFEAYLNSFAR